MEIFAIAFWILVLISSSNAVNLTDGLDGLATVPDFFFIYFRDILIFEGNLNYSEYYFCQKFKDLVK